MPLTAAEVALRAWIETSGGLIHRHVTLMHDTKEKGHAVLAKSGIKAGEIVLTIPLALCLHSRRHSEQSKAVQDTFQTIQDARTEPLEPFLTMTLIVMSLLAKGNPSELHAYLSTLPKSHNCLMGWSKAERSLFKGTSLEADARLSLRKTYEQIVFPVVQQCSALFPGDSGSFDTFANVAGIVQSRMFHLEKENWVTGSKSADGDLYLIPGIDMINHSTDEQARNVHLVRKRMPDPSTPTPAAATREDFTTNSQGPKRRHQDDIACAGDREAKGNKKRKVEPIGPSLAHCSTDLGQDSSGVDCFCMIASSDIAEGTELLHTYGDLSDAELLSIYGFIDKLPEDEHNRHNRVFVTSTDLAESCKKNLDPGSSLADFEARVLFLRENSILPDIICITGESLLSEDLLGITQILLNTDMESFSKFRHHIQTQEEQCGSVKKAFSDSGLGDGQQEMAVCKSLLGLHDLVLSQRLELKPTKKMRPDRVKLAQLVAAGELQVLKELKRELIALLVDLAHGAGSASDDDEESSDEEGPSDASDLEADDLNLSI